MVEDKHDEWRRRAAEGEAQMAARQKAFTTWQALRQGPIPFEEALSQLYIANARAFHVSLDDTYIGLAQLITPHLSQHGRRAY